MPIILDTNDTFGFDSKAAALDPYHMLADN